MDLSLVKGSWRERSKTVGSCHMSPKYKLWKSQKIVKEDLNKLINTTIKAIYSNISYLIKVKGGYLNPIPSTCGLKQGGVLSPSLFNIFIDDIKDIFDDSCDPVNLFDVPLTHLLYADDLILMARSK